MSRGTRCKRVYEAIFRSLRVASSLPAVAPLDGSFAANLYYRASLWQSLEPNKHQEIHFYDHFTTKDYYICAVNWIKLLDFVVSRMRWVSTSVTLRRPFTFYVDETVRLRLLGFYLSPIFLLLWPSPSYSCKNIRLWLLYFNFLQRDGNLLDVIFPRPPPDKLNYGLFFPRSAEVNEYTQLFVFASNDDAFPLTIILGLLGIHFCIIFHYDENIFKQNEYDVNKNKYAS